MDESRSKHAREQIKNLSLFSGANQRETVKAWTTSLLLAHNSTASKTITHQIMNPRLAVAIVSA